MGSRISENGSDVRAVCVESRISWHNAQCTWHAWYAVHGMHCMQYLVRRALVA
jgi:hypothetical protein